MELLIIQLNHITIWKHEEIGNSWLPEFGKAHPKNRCDIKIRSPNYDIFIHNPACLIDNREENHLQYILIC
jgi:hypothetical protein